MKTKTIKQRGARKFGTELRPYERQIKKKKQVKTSAKQNAKNLMYVTEYHIYLNDMIR